MKSRPLGPATTRREIVDCRSGPTTDGRRASKSHVGIFTTLGSVRCSYSLVHSGSTHGLASLPEPRTRNPTDFYAMLLPILEQPLPGLSPHGGHRADAVESYQETLPFAAAIRRAIRKKSMPPWFVDPKVGSFKMIFTYGGRVGTLPLGRKRNRRPENPRMFPGRNTGPKAGASLAGLGLKMPRQCLACKRDIEYHLRDYSVKLKENRWVANGRGPSKQPLQRASRGCIFRPPDSNWLRHGLLVFPSRLRR